MPFQGRSTGIRKVMPASFERFRQFHVVMIGIARGPVLRDDGPAVDEGHDVDAVDRIELGRAGRDGDGVLAAGRALGRDL